MTKDDPQLLDPPRQIQQSSQPLKESEKQRNFKISQKDDRRHTGIQRPNFKGNPDSRQAPEGPAESPEKEPDLDEEEETESDRSSRPQRHYRNGRPEKRIVEESANDPYCE